MFSFSLYPSEFNWGKILFAFIPIFLVALAFIATGWGIISGMRWRELLDDLLYIWH